MTLPKNPLRFGVTEMLLWVWDALQDRDIDWYTPSQIAAMADMMGNHYGVKGILLKLARAGLLEANFDINPMCFRLVVSDFLTEEQKELIAKFDRAREAARPRMIACPLPPAALDNNRRWR